MFRNLVSVRHAGPAALGAVVLSAALVLFAGAVRADDDGGRQLRRGDRPQRAQREQAAPREQRVQWRDTGARSAQGERSYSQRPSQERRGDRPKGGGSDHLRRGDRPQGGGSDHLRRGDGYRGNGGGSRQYGNGGRRYGGGDHSYGNGGRRYYDGHRYRAPYRVRYVRPHRVIRVGLGLPYYCPPSYRGYVVRRPVVREYVPSIEVENYPPAGCYYYDPYCEREFANLDDCTEHLDGADHSNTVEVVDETTGEVVRTLEFVDGYWSLRR